MSHLPFHPSFQPVSAVIICRNEERYIARCLNSLTWADEILVIDSYSTDRTPQICLDPTQPWSAQIRFLQNPWEGFLKQRNYALREAKHNWILVIDADEECSPELAKRILELLSAQNGPPAKAFKVRRVEYFLGKAIRHGIWNPSYQDRFFHRSGVRYVNEVHEYPLFPEPPLFIHESLHHSLDLNSERFLEKMNRYTTLEARERVDQGVRTNLFRIFFAFPAMFLKNYFYYGAYKDGIEGFIISLLEATSRVVRHIKIWQYSLKEDA